MKKGDIVKFKDNDNVIDKYKKKKYKVLKVLGDSILVRSKGFRFKQILIPIVLMERSKQLLI